MEYRTSSIFLKMRLTYIRKAVCLLTKTITGRLVPRRLQVFWDESEGLREDFTSSQGTKGRFTGDEKRQDPLRLLRIMGERKGEARGYERALADWSSCPGTAG